MTTSLDAYIKAVRAGLCMTQAQLAQLAHVSVSTISKAEAGHPVRPEIEQRIRRLLFKACNGLPVGYGTDPRKPRPRLPG